MDGFAHVSGGNLLFAEDFDLAEVESDPPADEPEVIEPTYSFGELSEAREAAWRDGHSAGLREAAADSVAAVHETATVIAMQLAEEREVAAARAERSAASIARLLLDSLDAAFPALCTRYGDAEVRSLVRIILPALTQEPCITVRMHPRTAEAVAQEIALLDPELSTRVQTVACDAMAPGDVRVVWRNGAATRDAAALWGQVAQALAPIKETTDGN
jgi:flagellar biosynthesis/type III secretory pathway protein FliH